MRWKYGVPPAGNEDDVPFEERFAALQTRLETQFAEADRLTATIRERLAGALVK